MPVIDWIRTDLDHKWEDGTSSLFFDRTKFALFDIFILKRENAENDYPTEIVESAKELHKTISETEKNALIDTIIVKTQGFVNGNINENDNNPVAIFKQFLALYQGINKEKLRENMQYFLENIMPVCDKYDIDMCVHPDDPPYQMLGLPRIVTDADDIEWFLKAVDNQHNGLTFCAGSLSAGIQNEVPELAKKFAERTKFVHLRSTNILPNGNFYESPHLEGRGHLIDVVRIFEKQIKQQGKNIPMRIDHGRLMLDDAEKGYNPGYSFYGRMFALAQMEGVIATVQNELMNNE
jgi:mannonate dehydratase